tara:strand:+ start:437 stop:1771 length:1335 start_codon:yes stop_codon:yes gene_type:complete
MASIIRVKRSTGTTAPATLNFGELGLTVGVGTHGNKGGRLFAGDNGSNPQEVGGRYFTDLLSIAPGLVAGQTNPTTAANGFVPIVDQSGKVDQWNVDNLRMDGNTLSSTDANGDILLDPAGSGEINVPDDTFLSFGTDKDGKIEYDEDGTDKIRVTGADWQFDCGIGITGGARFDNIAISTNTIASTSGNVLYIDPFPDGLSSDGLLIVKGSLQVDGTTTTVNSTNATLNDPVMHLGDVTSTRTVMLDVAVGVSTITLDSVVGINTGDILAATGIDASGIATVSGYNTTSKVVTFTGTSSAGITTESQVTVTHAFDTNTDRGISFSYNTGSGSANNKKGFFGYIDEGSSNTLSNAPDRSWTYIPEATVTANSATGVRGFLDVKGLYFQSSDYASSGNGIMYFDATGRSIVSAGTTAGITTSNFVLTTDASGVPKWTTTLDGGTF